MVTFRGVWATVGVWTLGVVRALSGVCRAILAGAWRAAELLKGTRVASVQSLRLSLALVL